MDLCREVDIAEIVMNGDLKICESEVEGLYQCGEVGFEILAFKQSGKLNGFIGV